MDNKVICKLKNVVHKFDKNKIIISVGIVGVFLILLSEFSVSNEDKSKSSNDVNTNVDYVEVLENKTTDIISNINGVGKCRVMITVMESNESVYAKNVDENNQHGYYSESNEYVLYKSNNGQTPMLIKENYPRITGVAVVCDGADKIEVKKEIIDVITSLYDISSSHISISKIKQ